MNKIRALRTNYDGCDEMSLLEEILEANKAFVGSRDHDDLDKMSKIPRRQLAIFTCMDTRLVDFLEPAMGISRGDAKIIKNAGNTVIDPDGGVIRSLVVAVFLLGVEEILVIGHKDCGMGSIEPAELIKKMENRGIKREKISHEKEFMEWLGAFSDPVANIDRVVDIIRKSPLLPDDVPVHGLIFDPHDGHLDLITSGY